MAGSIDANRGKGTTKTAKRKSRRGPAGFVAEPSLRPYRAAGAERAGGDSNGDGAATAGTPGYWDRIYLNGSVGFV